MLFTKLDALPWGCIHLEEGKFFKFAQKWQGASSGANHSTSNITTEAISALQGLSSLTSFFDVEKKAHQNNKAVKSNQILHYIMPILDIQVILIANIICATTPFTAIL